jgi:nucleolar protein 56
MKAYISTNIMGSFAFDSSGILLGYKLFPKSPEYIAERLFEIQNGNVIKEELELVQELRASGLKEIVWDRRSEIKDVACIYEPENIADKSLKDQFRKLALDLRWVSSQSELNQILTKVNVMLTEKKLRKPKRDKIIMQTIGVIDEMDRALNIFSEHLREWYGLHFPEASRLIQSQEKFAEIVAKYGEKDNFDDKKFADLAKKSAGMPFSSRDIENVQMFSQSLHDLYKTREKLSSYLESISNETIPNLSAVAGPLLGARMLSLAGGLEKISKMPSSTIQLLGAEKALFRHLKGQGRAPKYGVLFSHPLIQNSPRNMRGKIARIIASKITLAARFDKFSDKNQGQELKKDLEEKVKKLKEFSKTVSNSGLKNK